MPGLLLMRRPAAALPELHPLLSAVLDVAVPGDGKPSPQASLPHFSLRRFEAETRTAAQAPWAMALTEVVVMALLYLLVVHPEGFRHWHYDWWESQQDVLLFSAIRSLAALVSFFLGLGRRLHM